jgi:hypothetical protein
MQQVDCMDYQFYILYNMEHIPTLTEVLDAFEQGTLDMTELARKCYLSEAEKHYGRVSWIHNNELKNQLLLRSMSKNANRDFLKTRSK